MFAKLFHFNCREENVHENSLCMHQREEIERVESKLKQLSFGEVLPLFREENSSSWQ
jgi:hypothetical protein